MQLDPQFRQPIFVTKCHNMQSSVDILSKFVPFFRGGDGGHQAPSRRHACNRRVGHRNGRLNIGVPLLYSAQTSYHQ